MLLVTVVIIHSRIPNIVATVVLLLVYTSRQVETHWAAHFIDLSGSPQPANLPASLENTGWLCFVGFRFGV